MAKKVFFSPSDQSGNKYAVGNTVEQVQCERIAGYARIALERSGVEVKTAVNDRDFTYEHITVSNQWKPDLHVAIHTNATGLKDSKYGGTQIYYGAIGAEHAKTMLKYVKSAFPDTFDNSREGINGSKTSAWVEFSKVSAKTIYIEANFHDNAEIAQYIIDNVEKIGEAIAEGLCAVLGVPFVAPAKKEEGVLYRIQVGAFSVKENADNYLKQVQKTFPNAFIVKVE